MSQRKKKRDPTPTRVALVCLKTTQNNSHINNQTLHKIFSKHGSISKILIFERGQQLTKVFIEYDEVNAAIDAIKHLNNTKILNQISCNVYHSRLKQLKLDTVPYTKGVDFTNPPILVPEQVEQIEQIEQQQTTQIINEWQDFQFENGSTDEVSEEEEPQQFSEEKMKDINNKLDLIDDEIYQTIETKIFTALDKLQQNTMCLMITFTFNLNDINLLIKIFCLIGQIKSLKQNLKYIYVKYSSNLECQKAYNLLKQYFEIQILYNFETINGQFIPTDIYNNQHNNKLDDKQILQEIHQTYKIMKQQNNNLIQINQ